MPNAAIYARLSTDDRAVESSISRQIDQCQSQASGLGFAISPEHIYQDELTGTTLERPGLQRMLASLSQFTAVFVSAHDRLARIDWHTGYILHRFNEAGIVLYADGKPVESSLIAGIMALVAQEERNNLLKRMLDGKRRRAGWNKPPGEGRSLGGFMPLGYRYDAGRVIIVPDEAALVQRIYQLCLDGYGIYRITALLSSERLPTKSDRTGKPKKRGYGQWSDSSISRILHYEPYCTGIMYFNSRKSVEPQDDRRRKPKNLKRLKTASVLRDKSEWLPIPIEPIISRDVWDAVQVKIRENFQKSPRRRLNDYLLLGGRLRCYCGYAMSGSHAAGDATTAV